MVVGIFNRGDTPADCTLSWQSLSRRKTLKVRDLWKHEAVPNGDSYRAPFRRMA